MTDVRRRIERSGRLRPLLEYAAGGAGDDPGHDLSHALRVAAWTLELGGPDIDADAALAAALLHDVVNIPKDSPQRSEASAASAQMARALLPDLGFDAAAVTEIAEAILDHSFSRGATPRSALGRALQDADRLEALGALGWMRAVACGARMGSALFDVDDPWAGERAADDRRFVVDHYFVKLRKLPATMNTEAGRAEAQRRCDYLRDTLCRLAEELGVAPPDSERLDV